ncbi:g1275 [Coccomyxa viridis]|uniref:G1275 protein n=1 Tax=Coccomyxa viridis TaxID=1274662 RepID=A0ABP1FHM7_9CHLO
MTFQHGIWKVSRNVAVLGAAYWAADELQMGRMIAEVVCNSAEPSHCVPPTKEGLRPKVADIMPSLGLYFGAVPLTALQPLRHEGGYSRAASSRWQPSCYVAPDATYRAGVEAPASTLKGDTSATRRAAAVAAEQPEIAGAIHKVLEERGVSLPACHFRTPDIELVRYAITVGLLTARTPEERKKVIEAAAQRAQATAEWLESHEFMPQAELSNWVNVVHWAKDDTEGRPVLVVHLQAALKQDAAGAKRAAEAILTHMEYCLQQRMRDDLSGPEQVVVVLDSRGAPTLQFRRLVTAIQNIALTLNRHYPARLYRLYLVDAPAIVHLPVRAIKAMLHPSTSSKILICDSEDERLPVDLTQDSTLHQDGQL